MKWFNYPPDEVLEQLKTDIEQGLSGTEAANRLTKHGANELSECKTLPPFLLFLVQFNIRWL